jgi:hypothetical protein
MSTIPLLPPERSHICIALASLLWAQSLAGSGVGTAAAALGASEAAPPLALAAGALAAGALDAPPPAALGALDDELELQAAMTRMTTIARAGSLRWVLIQSPPIVQILGDRPLDRRSNTLGCGHSIMTAIECIHSIS